MLKFNILQRSLSLSPLRPYLHNFNVPIFWPKQFRRADSLNYNICIILGSVIKKKFNFPEMQSQGLNFPSSTRFNQKVIQ